MCEPADGQLDLGTACGSGSQQVTDLMRIRKFGNLPSTCGPIGGVSKLKEGERVPLDWMGWSRRTWEKTPRISEGRQQPQSAKLSSIQSNGIAKVPKLPDITLKCKEQSPWW